MNHRKPETTIAVPVLRGFTESGTPLPPEPILCFDRNLQNGYDHLKWKLEQRMWRPDTIEQFLDDLGFRP